MLFFSPPESFQPKFEIVSCFVEQKGKILLLLRNDNKPEGNTFGVPAGKRNPGESIDEAILRELHEESGIRSRTEHIHFFKTVFVRFDKYDFTYHIFHLTLEKSPLVVINSAEHKKFLWLSPANALKENLIQDLDECIKLFYPSH